MNAPPPTSQTSFQAGRMGVVLHSQYLYMSCFLAQAYTLPTFPEELLGTESPAMHVHALALRVCLYNHTTLVSGMVSEQQILV